MRAFTTVFFASLLVGCASPGAPPSESLDLDVPSWLEARDCDAAAVFRRAGSRRQSDPYGTLRAVASCRTVASAPLHTADLDGAWADSPQQRLADGRPAEAALGALDLMAGGRALARGFAMDNHRLARQEIALVEVILAAVPHLDADHRAVVVSRLAELDDPFPSWDPAWPVDHGLGVSELEQRRAAYLDDLRTRSDGRPRHADLGLPVYELRNRWKALRAVLVTTDAPS